jgi:hypothetical protein
MSKIKIRYIVKDEYNKIHMNCFHPGDIELQNPLYWITSILGDTPMIISHNLFTGKKDINEKEVYENDIVKKRCLVQMKNNSSRETREWTTKNILVRFEDQKFKPSSLQDCEIIGNIYENPELELWEYD